MTQVATALAERYRELGFRVIEGGKSTKLVVVNSVRLAEKFGKRHDHVLRDIKEFRNSLAPNLGAVIGDHVRDSHYFDRTGRKLSCFDLTQIGFEAIALGYDADLRFRYVLTFHELQQELGLEARSITRPVADRLQELRGDWIQPEFDLEPSQAEKNAEANRRHIEVLVGKAHTPRGYASEHAEAVEYDAARNTWHDGIVVPTNPFLGERIPPAAWGKPLIKNRAHHIRRGEDRSFACQCHLHEDGVLAEFWIYSEPMRSTNMHERFLLMNTPQEFLCRFDWSVDGLSANELLTCERQCPKSPLTDQQAEAVLTLLLSGQC